MVISKKKKKRLTNQRELLCTFEHKGILVKSQFFF